MSEETERVGQDEIEALLQQAKQAGGQPAAEMERLEGAGEPTLSQKEAGPPTKQGKAKSQTSATGGADAEKVLDQEEIDQLLDTAPASPVDLGQSSSTTAKTKADREERIREEDVELLLREAEQALETVNAETSGLPQSALNYSFREFKGATPTAEAATLELVRDLDLDVKIELGRTHMYLQDVLKLRKGSVVALDKMAGDPVDIYVNGRLIARGEVLVMNDNFCVRVAELIASESAVA